MLRLKYTATGSPFCVAGLYTYCFTAATALSVSPSDKRREIVALNKIDLVADREELDPIEKELRDRGCDVHRISGATGEGVDALMRAMVSAIDAEESAEEAS